MNLDQLTLWLKSAIVLFLPIYCELVTIISCYMAYGGDSWVALYAAIIMTPFIIMLTPIFWEKVGATDQTINDPTSDHYWLRWAYPFALCITCIYSIAVIAMSIASFCTSNVLIKNLVQRYWFYITAIFHVTSIFHPEDFFTALTSVVSGIITFVGIGLIVIKFYTCYQAAFQHHRVHPVQPIAPPSPTVAPTPISSPRASSIELITIPNANPPQPPTPPVAATRGFGNLFQLQESKADKYAIPSPAATFTTDAVTILTPNN